MVPKLIDTNSYICLSQLGASSSAELGSGIQIHACTYAPFFGFPSAWETGALSSISRSPSSWNWFFACIRYQESLGVRFALSPDSGMSPDLHNAVELWSVLKYVI